MCVPQSEYSRSGSPWRSDDLHRPGGLHGFLAEMASPGGWAHGEMSSSDGKSGNRVDRWGLRCSWRQLANPPFGLMMFLSELFISTEAFPAMLTREGTQHVSSKKWVWLVTSCNFIASSKHQARGCDKMSCGLKKVGIPKGIRVA